MNRFTFRRAWEAMLGVLIAAALAALSGFVFVTLYFRQHGG